MKPTYLYVKQHNTTGLKYFGKTTRNVEKYIGSGLHWKRHIKHHGRNVKTVWVSEPFYDKNLLVEFATFFSDFFNIVNCSNWANLKEENGLDGGGNHSANLHIKKKISKSVINWSKNRDKNEVKKQNENHSIFMKERWSGLSFEEKNNINLNKSKSSLKSRKTNRICRLHDKKEMTVQNFVKYTK
jgi:hypothetical protein